MAEIKEKKKILNLDDFNKECKKLFGKDSITTGSNKVSYGDVIRPTSFSLASSLDTGGIAKGKLSVFEGESGGGKSTTVYDLLANCQKQYGNDVLLIEKENSYTKEYGATLGIDNDKLTVLVPHALEDMYDAVILALESGLLGAIAIDSVTAFAPETRFEGSVVMGVEARVNSDKMRLVMDALENSNTALIYIMQIRQEIGGYGDPNTLSGGTAIPFYAHVRVRITRSDIDRENQQNVIKFTIMKNKMGIPFKVGTVTFKWGKGFDFFSEVAELAIEFGIIKVEGKTYYFPEVDDFKVVGKKKAIEYLNENPEYTHSVIEPKVKEFLMSTNLRPDDIDESEAAI